MYTCIIHSVHNIQSKTTHIIYTDESYRQQTGITIHIGERTVDSVKQHISIPVELLFYNFRTQLNYVQFQVACVMVSSQRCSA